MENLGYLLTTFTTGTSVPQLILFALWLSDHLEIATIVLITAQSNFGYNNN